MRVATWLSGFLLGIGLSTLAIPAIQRLQAQKAERGTQQWTIAIDAVSKWGVLPLVHVVDTTGVCLYVVTSPTKASTIAAVPKTQLPPGTGCQ